MRVSLFFVVHGRIDVGGRKMPQNIWWLKKTKIPVSASHTVGRGFASRWGHTKDHHKIGTNCLPA